MLRGAFCRNHVTAPIRSLHNRGRPLQRALSICRPSSSMAGFWIGWRLRLPAARQRQADDTQGQ